MDRDAEKGPLTDHLVKRAVRGWRRIDARFNRPASEGRAWPWLLLLPSGVVWYAPMLALACVLGMALGPAPRTGGPQIAMLILGLGGILLVHLNAMRPVLHGQNGGFLWRICAGYLLVLFLMALILVALAGAESYGDRGLQLHVGAAVAPSVCLGLALAGWLSSRLLRDAAPGAMAGLLGDTDLFSPRERYRGDTDDVLLVVAALVALIQKPDRILLPAALLMLFLDESARDVIGRGWHGELWLLLVVTLVSWGVVTMGLVHERLMEILDTIGRLFFIGPQRVLSWLLIAIALLRLMENHFITYLFAGGVSVLVIYILLAYVVAWLYGFWCDLFLARRMLPLLKAPDDLDPPYRYRVFQRPETRDTGADLQAAEDGPSSPLSSVMAYGRSLALHGAGRFKIEGVHDADYADQQGIRRRALAFLTPQQLTTRLRALAEERDDAETLGMIRNVQRGTAIYPAVTALIAFAMLAVPFYVGGVAAIQPAVMVIRPGPGGSYDLAAALEGHEHPASSCDDARPGDPRIALALSGGGTRAALHAVAVLRGLAADGQICNLIAVSGVSGGAAALGYFAVHEGDLRRPDFDPKAWAAFGEAMADPFIDEVLAGQSSLRTALGRFSWRDDACGERARPYEHVVGWYPPARTRSGSILAEDFVCTFGARRLDGLPFAALFNTSMLGRFDSIASSCRDGRGTLASRASRCGDELDGAHAGSRLVLTNLPVLGQASDVEGVEDWLVTLDQPGISLARAAALSANFPPVFPDAAIDMTHDGRQGLRYWVTDGGAIENRGAVTLYLALLDALSAPGMRLSGPLQVIVADASSLAGNYRESRGLRSVTGAGARLAVAMERELAARLVLKARSAGSTFQSHELVMPAPLVEAIGTHWRLPGAVTLGADSGQDGGLVGTMLDLMSYVDPADAPRKLRLSGEEIAELVDCLYSRDDALSELAPDKAATALETIARQDPDWKKGASWHDIEQALGVTAPPLGLCGGLGPSP